MKALLQSIGIHHDEVSDAYTVLAPVLSDLDKQKVCAIEDIDKIQFALSGHHITPEQFEGFMLMEIEKLDTIIHDQSCVLNTVKYKQSINPNDDPKGYRF